MTNQIEKEFFEANEVKIFKYYYIIEKSKWSINKGVLYSKNDIIYWAALLKSSQYPRNIKITKVERYYPPITPEIILKLEEVVCKNGGFLLDTTINTECWQYTSKRPKQCSGWFDNKKDALLKLCTKLAPGNKEEVQQLFKGE